MTDRMERYATLAIRVGTTPVVITRPGVSIVWPTPEQMAATAQAHAEHVVRSRELWETNKKRRAAMERAEMIVETFDYNGVHIEIEECPECDPLIYLAHYQTRRSGRTTIAPFYSIEEVCNAIKQRSDEGGF